MARVCGLCRMVSSVVLIAVAVLAMYVLSFGLYCRLHVAYESVRNSRLTFKMYEPLAVLSIESSGAVGECIEDYLSLWGVGRVTAAEIVAEREWLGDD